MISFLEAQDNLHELCSTWLESHALERECIPLSESLGRYLSTSITAQRDLPPTDVSAMDGYAVSPLKPLKETGALAGEGYDLVGESRAGEPYSGVPLERGQCVRIFTGAVVPVGALLVVMQEHVIRQSDNAIGIREEATAGANIRRRGEEVSAGACLADVGQRITPNMIPLLASQGVGEVDVYAKLRVAFLATGDELKAAGDTLGPGDIYESNLASLEAVLGYYAVDGINMGVVEDTPEAISASLTDAARIADVVITSGGVSVGDYDFVRECVESMGEVTDYKVAMKPGKPVCFGRLRKPTAGHALFLGLPGNPVSSFVVLTELYLPALRLLMNRTRLEPNLQLVAILDTDVRRRAGRLEFQRGVLRSDYDERGVHAWHVRAFGSQDSHRVLGLAQANCILQIPADVSHIPAGTTVTVSILPWFQSA